MNIYYINLERSPLRRERLEKCLNLYSLSFTRIDAVDAKTLSDESAAQFYDPKINSHGYFSTLKKSEIACFLSHRKALRQFLDESDDDFALILEDDVEFIDDPKLLLDALKNKFIWNDNPIIIKLFSIRKNKTKKICPLSEKYNLVMPELCPLSASAQIFNRSGARKLLEKSNKFSLPIDVMLQFYWDIPISVLQVEPNPIRNISFEVGGSTISEKSIRFDFNKFKREIQRPIFRFRLWIISKLHHQSSMSKIIKMIGK